MNTYTGRHRAPASALTLARDLYAITAPLEATYARHIADGRTDTDALALTMIDTDDVLGAWEQATS